MRLVSGGMDQQVLVWNVAELVRACRMRGACQPVVAELPEYGTRMAHYGAVDYVRFMGASAILSRSCDGQVRSLKAKAKLFPTLSLSLSLSLRANGLIASGRVLIPDSLSLSLSLS